MCGRVGCVSFAVLAVGCAGFQLQPYDKIVWDTSERTQSLQSHRPTGRTLNRAAMLPGRSQADIKPVLASLWQPSMRPSAWLNYNGLLATRYSQLDTPINPIFQPGELVVRHLGTETRVKYISAFHAGRRLPLVVGTSGINGTVDGKITMDILQHLYDTGEFHVIHLEANTGVSHQVRNQRPFGGGFPEGLLLYETVAKLRARTEFADQINQVHLLGVSFGGMLSGLAAYCEGEFREGVIDGAVLAFSPPFDLRVLFDNIAVLPIIHDRIHESYLEEGMQRMKSYADFGNDIRDAKQLDFDGYFRKVAVPHARSIYPDLKAKLPDLAPLRNDDDVYAISSLRPFLNRLGVPFFYFYAYDDPVLSPQDHFHYVLAECPNPLVDGILLKDGGHLGYDTLSPSTPGFTARVAERYFRYWSASQSLGNSTMPTIRRASSQAGSEITSTLPSAK